MKLTDLNAKITMTNFLVFDCPCGNCGGRIRVALEPSKDARGQSWKHSGVFPEITVRPSINAGCWHGWITRGEVAEA